MRPGEKAAAKPSPHPPSILLEGDEPRRPPVAGQDLKYALGPAPAPAPAAAATEELPEAYGTGRLLLAARDPRCVYAHWDISAERQRHYNALSVHHHLVVRVHQDTPEGRTITEVHVHPESRHWFLHVEQPGGKYVAELGYYLPGRQWQTVAVSEPVATPAGAAIAEKAVRFATLPAAPPMAAGKAASPRLPVETIPWPFPPPPLPGEPADAYVGKAGLPQPVTLPTSAKTPGKTAQPAELILAAAGDWTPAQERAVAELLSRMLGRQELPGSAEILDLIRRQAERGIWPAEAGQFGQAVSPSEALGISSPLGRELPTPKGFWFNVNAELVIYGATEPDAQVTIGGRAIRLRPDGTFSCRFALPDGVYALPLAATSTAGETRQVELHFQRSTQYRSEVGAHPQDPALKPPTSENVG